MLGVDINLYEVYVFDTADLKTTFLLSVGQSFVSEHYFAVYKYTLDAIVLNFFEKILPNSYQFN